MRWLSIALFCVLFTSSLFPVVSKLKGLYGCVVASGAIRSDSIKNGFRAIKSLPGNFMENRIPLLLDKATDGGFSRFATENKKTFVNSATALVGGVYFLICPFISPTLLAARLFAKKAFCIGLIGDRIITTAWRTIECSKWGLFTRWVANRISGKSVKK